MPLTEIHQGDFSPLFRYTLAIMLLAIGGAWLFIRIQNRPLVDLEHAALQVGKGIIPPPLRGMARPRCVPLPVPLTIWRLVLSNWRMTARC